MTNLRARWLALGMLGVLAAAVTAQEPARPAGNLPPEAISAWQYYQELPALQGQSKYIDFLVTPGIFDKARYDLADLRLRDGRGREIPYALRVRRSEMQLTTLTFREFNHAKLPDGADELSLDLGADPVEHNEMVLSVSGTNFRRRVQLEGSDNGEQWKTLEDKGRVVRYEAEGQSLDVRRIRYPTSRFRYLRVRVHPDPLIANDRPTIDSVTMNQLKEVPGEYVTLSATLGQREPVRTYRGYGSAWTIDLGAEVPVEKLTFTIDSDDFVRDYELEVLSNPDRETLDAKGGPARPYDRPYDRPYEKRGFQDERNIPYYPVTGVQASGQWRRRAGHEPRPIEITLGSQVRARRLKLIVTDNRNVPLEIRSVQYSAAARQVIFERPAELAEPVRLYFDNPSASAPNYDFAANLPVTLPSPPQRFQFTSDAQPNPEYRPSPKPWTDRWPWVIYVVLGIASAALLGILGVLARQTIQRHDQAEIPGERGASAP